MSTVINRVEKEFIFKFLMQNRVELEIRTKSGIVYSKIITFNPKEIKVELSSVLDEFFEENVQFEVFFYFQNCYHKFISNILKVNDNIAIISNPENIAKNPQRKYERKKVDGKLNAKFKIKGDLVPLNYPITQIYYYPGKPPVESELFDLKLENIIQKFNEKMSSYVSFNKIVMIR